MHRTNFEFLLKKIKGDDKDSGKYGKLKYSILGNNSFEYFSIDDSSGIIKTKKSFSGIESDDLPFKLNVLARDNPNGTTEYNEISSHLIINLITQLNELILVIGDAQPDTVATKLDTIIQVIQDQTGLIVGIVKLNAREIINANGTLETDESATDVWFYLIDPENDCILPINHSIVQR